MVDSTKAFTQIYEKSQWGSNNNDTYNGSSGSGSSIAFNIESYIPKIRLFIINNNIKKVVDLGSGDWQSSQLIYKDLDVEYYGYDCYEKVCITNKKLYPQYNLDYLLII